jgi:hypothetical protein
VDIFEIEWVPHGWGFLYYPLYARYIRTLGKPFNGITARFHKSWGDFGTLKSRTQLKYETATMIMHGGMCSIGDQMDHRGRLQSDTYRTIGEVYSFIQEREEWCKESSGIPYVGVLADDEKGTLPVAQPPSPLWGAMKALMELHYHFDIIDGQSNLTDYAAVVLPGNKDMSCDLAERLKEYVRGGGKVLASHLGEVPASLLGELFGIEIAGEFNYSLDYIRMSDDSVMDNLPEMNLAVYGRSQCVRINGNAVTLARIVHPLCERTSERFYSHLQAPGSDTPDSPGITMQRYGKGVAAYIVSPVFGSYFEDGNPVVRIIVGNVLKKILPDHERVLVVDAPVSVEVSLMRQKKTGRLVLHLVNYHAEKRGRGMEVIEQIPEIHDISVRLKSSSIPGKVYLAPSCEGLEYRYEKDSGFLHFKVPHLHIHQMVVIEL